MNNLINVKNQDGILTVKLEDFFTSENPVLNEIFKPLREATANLKNANHKVRKAVYIAEFSNGLIKIGVTKDINKRFAVIQKQCGAFLVRHNACLFENAYKYESLLHKQFKDFRVNGEFFNCKYDDVLDYCKAEVFPNQLAKEEN